MSLFVKTLQVIATQSAGQELWLLVVAAKHS
jgi:hypothetical protein